MIIPDNNNRLNKKINKEKKKIKKLKIYDDCISLNFYNEII